MLRVLSFKWSSLLFLAFTNRCLHIATGQKPPDSLSNKRHLKNLAVGPYLKIPSKIPDERLSSGVYCTALPRSHGSTGLDGEHKAEPGLEKRSRPPCKRLWFSWAGPLTPERSLLEMGWKYLVVWNCIKVERWDVVQIISSHLSLGFLQTWWFRIAMKVRKKGEKKPSLQWGK